MEKSEFGKEWKTSPESSDVELSANFWAKSLALETEETAEVSSEWMLQIVRVQWNE